MESEKVKEIKEAWAICSNEEENCDSCPYFGRCKEELTKDTLILINELESENERLSKELDSEWKDRRKAEEDLHKAQWNYKIGLSQSRKRNNELKDRIAELEKGNEALSFAVKQGFNDCQEKTLKQFAERLKDKLKDNANGANVNYYVECAKIMSETLEEFTK